MCPPTLIFSHFQDEKQDVSLLLPCTCASSLHTTQTTKHRHIKAKLAHTSFHVYTIRFLSLLFWKYCACILLYNWLQGKKLMLIGQWYRFYSKWRWHNMSKICLETVVCAQLVNEATIMCKEKVVVASHSEKLGPRYEAETYLTPCCTQVHS